MLLKMKHLMLMEEAVGENKFKARENLTNEEIDDLLELDAWYYDIEKDHLIINHEELRKKRSG